MDLQDFNGLEELRSSPRAKDRVLAAIFDRQTTIGTEFQQLKEDTSHVRRAIYGDETNKVPGVLEMTHKNHSRIKRLEQIVGWGTGALATLGLFWDSIKIKIIGH